MAEHYMLRGTPYRVINDTIGSIVIATNLATLRTAWLSETLWVSEAIPPAGMAKPGFAKPYTSPLPTQAFRAEGAVVSPAAHAPKVSSAPQGPVLLTTKVSSERSAPVKTPRQASKPIPPAPTIMSEDLL